ncbi:MAG: substrate-binding domain-containing protein [Acidobacteriota bacterium]
MRCVSTAALALLLLFSVAGESPAAAAEPPFQLIVHPDVEGTQIRRAVLSSIFLRESPNWGDGSPIRPVDQSLRSPVRATFSEYVLNEPTEGIHALWRRKINEGVSPPKVRSSDEEVIAFVEQTKGSIGYVSLSTPLPPTVKTLVLVD